ncbi:TPA: RNA polymerase sigma factor [Clostridium botulinum]|nr:RNA polymerase sigma factor [Clostridium botulinum]
MDNSIIIELYKKQFQIITLYLIKCGCNFNDAEDIVHDSFIKAIQYIDSIDILNLSSWLFKVAINNYKNKVKRGKIINSISIYEESFYEELMDNYNLEEVIINKEKSLQILKVLNELKETYKSLLIFKYEMNLSYKEISLFLGMDENMVKTYLYRARNKFKEEWRLFNEKSRR